VARQGKDRKGKGALCPIFIFIFIRLGLDRRGKAGHGWAWRGKDRKGKGALCPYILYINKEI